VRSSRQCLATSLQKGRGAPLVIFFLSFLGKRRKTRRDGHASTETLFPIGKGASGRVFVNDTQFRRTMCIKVETKILDGSLILVGLGGMRRMHDDGDDNCSVQKEV
jgi:hypothetical protein